MMIMEPKREITLENHSNRIIQEEELMSIIKNEETKSLSEFIINKLFQISNLEEANIILQAILKEYHSNFKILVRHRLTCY